MFVVKLFLKNNYLFFLFKRVFIWFEYLRVYSVDAKFLLN